MEEYESLKAILRCDDHSIPQAAIYWYFFKRHILEKDHVPVEFYQNLDRKSYKELLLLHANPCVYGPQFCRLRNAETRRRNINELVSVTSKCHLRFSVHA